MSTRESSGSSNKPPTDDEVRALLDRYRCPLPFHVVRTRFLGRIASPVMAPSPMDAVAGLWGGALPAIDSSDTANELMRVLGVGLWTQLEGHVQRNAPFRLIRIQSPATREGLARIALIRKEEVIGFIQGLFGGQEGLAFPKRACRALEALAEAGALFNGVYQVTSNPGKPASVEDVVETWSHIRELTNVCEREIHEVVLSCTDSRREFPSSMPTGKPTLH
ncbi:MAG: hypothetical protein JO358_07720 [Alphaproteobacteria bacterium]|nr:hypothetical protein [Alphaproteobacteria bacterium]